MKAQFAAVLFALTTGCVASGGYSGGVVVATPQPVVTATVTTDPVDNATYDDDIYEGEPDLVEYEGNANIRVVYGSSDPVFYSDGFYWRYGDDGTWFRSTVHTGGWAVYADVPVHVRTIDRPTRFRSYKPSHYTPKVRKVGVRPATSRPAYRRTYDQNNRPAHRATPAHHDNKPDNRNYGNNRPDNRPAPAHHDNRPDNRPGYKEPAHKEPAHTTPAHNTPAKQPGYKEPAHTAPAHTTPAHTTPPPAKQPPAAYKEPPKKDPPATPKKEPPKKDDKDKDKKDKDKRR